MDTYHYIQIGLAVAQVVIVPLAIYAFKQFQGLARQVAKLQTVNGELQRQIESGVERCRERSGAADRLAAKIDRLEDRVSANEARLESHPDAKALHELALVVERTVGEIRAVTAKLGGLEAVVGKLDRVLERQEHYLLTKGA